jgi:hypothetical protein
VIEVARRDSTASQLRHRRSERARCCLYRYCCLLAELLHGSSDVVLLPTFWHSGRPWRSGLLKYATLRGPTCQGSLRDSASLRVLVRLTATLDTSSFSGPSCTSVTVARRFAAQPFMRKPLSHLATPEATGGVVGSRSTTGRADPGLTTLDSVNLAV